MPCQYDGCQFCSASQLSQHKFRLLYAILYASWAASCCARAGLEVSSSRNSDSTPFKDFSTAALFAFKSLMSDTMLC